MAQADEAMSAAELSDEVLVLALDQVAALMDQDGLNEFNLALLKSLVQTVHERQGVPAEAETRLNQIFKYALGIANSNMQHGPVGNLDLNLFVSLLELTRD